MRYVGICSVVILSLLLPRNAGAQQLLSYDIGAQPVEQALNTFAFQNNMSLIFPSREAARGLMSREVRGRLTREAALKQMLEGTGLHYEFSTESAAVFVRAESAGALSGPELDQEVDLTDEGASSRATASGEPWAASGAERSGMPQVLIQTKRTLNIDTERSRDGVQPHIVFDRDAIQKSGDKSVSEFLKRRLTMGVANSATAQEKLAVAGAGELDLHGFGSNQTLVLIDGRRLPGSAAGGPAVQPDLDGIPLSAVERIEVLPTAASGIYGGGATGGVINIVLRRDYVGTEARLQYENPFDDAAGDRQVHVSHGFRLQEGRAHVLLRGTYSRQETLSDRDRPFLEQGRRQILANNPDYFAQSASVPLGALTNIRSANRQPLFGPGTPSFTHVPPGYESSMGAAALAGNAGTYNWGLASTA